MNQGKKPGESGVRALLEQGLKRHRAGQFAEALILYEQALVQHPTHPDALHLAGVAALQCGRAGQAVARIEAAVRQQPDHPGFQGNLAHAYFELNRYAEAHAAFRRAATLDPRAPQFEVGAANCLALQGRVAEAELQLRDVVRRHPGFALAWFNLARAVRDQARPAEAASLFQRAIELDPAFADAYTGLGNALQAMERLDDAERAYREYLVRQPGSEAGHCNLAFVLMDRGAFAEAVAVCRRALETAPGSAELHLVMGAALAHQGRLTAALEAFDQAVGIDPENPRARWAYGYALVETGRTQEGLRWLQALRTEQPQAAEFRDSLSLVLLSLGDLREGWADYPGRATRLKFQAENPGLRLSDELPDDLSGRTVCLLREQGLGDELFFLRFAAELKARGARIVYQAHPKIASLAGRVPALDQLTPWNEPPPAADAVLLVGDLPRVLGKTDASPWQRRGASPQPTGEAAARGFPIHLRIFHPGLPPPLGLSVMPHRLEDAKRRLAERGPPPYRGVTWRAGTPPAQQRGQAWVLHKEIGLDAFGAALRGVGGTWVALQRNPGPGEIERLSACAGTPVGDFSALNEDLEAMLALLALLDDYIGVSNTNMHLRAGTGRAARVLVPRPAEWRWLAAGDTSPWFPGFRVYRQRTDGDWGKALERLRDDLLVAK